MAITRKNYIWSWGYWFGSRTQGLLIHPYITMREIAREKFLRPLVFLPVVIWLMSWIVAIIVGRIGLWFSLEDQAWTVPLGKIVVFAWVWGSCFLLLWQVLLTYLYVRFRRLGD